MPPYYGNGGVGPHLQSPMRSTTSASWLSLRSARYLALLSTFFLLALVSIVWEVRSLVLKGIVDAKYDSGSHMWQNFGVMQDLGVMQDGKSDMKKETGMMSGETVRKLRGGRGPLHIVAMDDFVDEKDVSHLKSQKLPQFLENTVDEIQEDLTDASADLSEILMIPEDIEDHSGDMVDTSEDAAAESTWSSMATKISSQAELSLLAHVDSDRTGKIVDGDDISDEHRLGAEQEKSFSSIAREAMSKQGLIQQHVDPVLPLSLPKYDTGTHQERVAQESQTDTSAKSNIGGYSGPTEKKYTAREKIDGSEAHIDMAEEPTSLKHIVFGVASSMTSWPRRSPTVRSWFDRTEIRGHVWVDSLPSEIDLAGPDIRVQSDTGHLQYTGTGRRDYLRMARIVKDSFQLSTATWPPGSVRWLVMGDDDTFFNPGGITALLAKYDHTNLLYIGSQSETHWQNNVNSHDMAYGGGGFAISWPLAEALNRTMDACLERHVELWGSDMRVAYCCAELGVKVTNEIGFHQCDLGASLAGFLESHPLQVFASIHHIDNLFPLYPGMADRTLGLQKMAQFMRPDPVGFVQQAICYDQEGPLDWTASISWGFSAKFYPKYVRVSELEKVERTFHTFTGSWDPNQYDLDTRQPRDMSPLNEVCSLPFAMYCTHVMTKGDGSVESFYERSNALWMNRSHCATWPSKLTSLRVIRSRPLKVPKSSLGLSLGVNLIRQCCTRSNVGLEGNDTVGTIWLSSCGKRI